MAPQPGGRGAGAAVATRQIDAANVLACDDAPDPLRGDGGPMLGGDPSGLPVSRRLSDCTQWRGAVAWLL